MMNLRMLPLSIVLISGLAGCNKVYWAKGESTPTPPRVAEPVAEKKVEEPARTEEARGELREALLNLQRVHFPYNSATLLPSARKALGEAARVLSGNADVQLFVDGHTDLRGTEERNLQLGRDRAAAVARFLTSRGVPEERLSVSSFGKAQPLSSGDAVADHAKNRRVEYRLMRGSVRLVVEEGVLLDDSGRPLRAARPAAETPSPPSASLSAPATQPSTP